MPGGRRGPGRQQLSRSSQAVHQPLTGPQTPRHRNSGSTASTTTVGTALVNVPDIHHPIIPSDSPEQAFLFEAILYTYLLMALFLQYINIYRTVFWLHDGPSLTSLNFHLIDWNVVIFLLLMLTCRFAWTFIVGVYSSGDINLTFWAAIIAKCTLITGLFAALVWTVVRLFQTISVFSILLLMCPFVLFFIVYGSENSTLFGESEHSPNKEKQAFVPSPYLSEVIHHCEIAPELTRHEVEVMRKDFNSRIKRALFHSIVSAYYVGFIPVCFVQQTLYFDVWWCCQLIVFVWLSSFIMLVSHLLPPKYCDTLHQSALHLGKWQKLDHGYSSTPHYMWSDTTVWPQGVLVKYNKSLYKAMGKQNVAYPSDGGHTKFYMLFHKPLLVLTLLVAVQLVLVLYQVYLLVVVSQWNYVITLSLFLFCNYYNLYKLLRERFFLGKVYAVQQSND